LKNLISLTLVVLLAGCTFPVSRGAKSDPFQVELDGRTKWTERHKGFDSDLPGYHVTGDIASIVLRPRPGRLPDKMVIAIKTSPGMMRPMLEHFKVTTKDVTLTQPFSMALV